MTLTLATLAEIAQGTRRAAQSLAQLSTLDRNRAMEFVAQSLEACRSEILAANQADCRQAQANGLSDALYARLKLDASKLEAAIAGCRSVAQLPDPLAVLQIHRELDQGLILKRITCPLGVLGVIFEARPDAVIQISALGIKSGNGVILKGGQEAVQSCQALVQAIQQGLVKAGLSAEMIALLTNREETLALLQLDDLVDLIIPRGSNAFVRFVQEHTQIPVLGHAEGICHLYVDQAADLDQAVSLAVDAKTQYPAACNAIETLLVHGAISPQFLPLVAAALQSEGVSLRGDACAAEILGIPLATSTDWATEYSDLILSIRVVDSLAAGIEHINTYGSGHTEAICTQDPAAAAIFLAQVDAAGVFQNCSTRFSDGFRYGFGAEVGISTQKLPPRGPVGLEGLVTYKYQLTGQGHTVAAYSGQGSKPFTHRELGLGATD
jgi:glutamate-5-semialdehyde dehydrogenase